MCQLPSSATAMTFCARSGFVNYFVKRGYKVYAVSLIDLDFF